MISLRGKVALVTGGSSGVGKATVKAVLAEGARVTAVARGAARLSALRLELGEGLATRQGDVSDPVFTKSLLGELTPDLVILAAGIAPQMGTFDEFEWESFSAVWNVDLKATFHLLKQALTLPLRDGSTLVVVSSGAALHGSPLSGGYAGAKRMQWLLASYAQRVADAKQLGIRTIAVLPGQFIEGTTIGANAAAAYGAMKGISAEAEMKRFKAPLNADAVATAILGALRGDVPAGISAIAVNGTGIEQLT